MSLRGEKYVRSYPWKVAVNLVSVEDTGHNIVNCGGGGWWSNVLALLLFWWWNNWVAMVNLKGLFDCFL